MSSESQHDNRLLLIGIAAFTLLGLAWFWGLRYAPSEEHMGEIYRIIYVHVPSAFTAFISAGLILVLSLMTLFRRSETASLWAKASAEVGLVFTIVTLVTGSIWGRPTWGVWWTWDARLTTTLILSLLYAGYLILYSSLAPGPQRDRITAVLGIIIALDVPVIYKSVTWWRTLHQPPSILREGGSSMAPEMLTTLFLCLGASLLVAVWMIVLRVSNLKLQQKLEEFSYRAQN